MWMNHKYRHISLLFFWLLNGTLMLLLLCSMTRDWDSFKVGVRHSGSCRCMYGFSENEKLFETLQVLQVLVTGSSSCTLPETDRVRGVVSNA